MDNPFNYTKKEITQIFSEVNTLFYDKIDEGIADYTLKGLKKLFEGALKAEVEGYLRTEKYKHQDPSERIDYRNGYYHRNLVTSFGLLEDLKVPRTRNGGYQSQLFDPYQRRWKRVDDWIRDLFISGVSTRDVSWVMESLLKVEVSRSEVSVIVQMLDNQVRAYHRRELADDYVYIFFDGVTVKVRSCGKVVKKLVLVAYGIRSDGTREMIDYRVAKSESEQDWTVFLNDLYRRGLKGERLRMIVIDGGKGLKAALDMVYPHAKRQRCWVHKLRNMANKLPARHRDECLKGAQKIYWAANKTEAIKCFKAWKQKWGKLVPKVVDCLEKDLEELLTFFDEDKKLWSKLRTTNAIERVFRELRKRTRPMCSFANINSCDRIIFCLFKKYNNKWKEHRYHVAA
jgi:transposase-like protein